MKKTFVLLFFFFSLTSFSQEDELYLNYLAAARNGSTSQCFLVIKYKNLNNNEIREICIEGNQLVGALHKENKLNYDDSSYSKIIQILNENKQRYFEFKNNKALEILIVPYSQTELEKYQKEINFKKLARIARRKKSWSKYLEEKEMLIYAHNLFNEGILTFANGCIYDNILRKTDRKDVF